jgi:hypothetical protein
MRTKTRAKVATKRGVTKPATKRTPRLAHGMGMVDLKNLKAAKYNPPDRMKKDLKTLMDSFKKHGQIIPIVVGQGDELVEGHRRVAAARKLGWTELKAIRVLEDAPIIFREINVNTHKHNGAQTMQVYMADKRAVSDKIRKEGDLYLSLIGRPAMKKMADEGAGFGSMRLAYRLLKKGDCFNKRNFLTLVNYMWKNKNSYAVRLAFRNGTTPAQILKTAKSGQLIKIRYA